MITASSPKPQKCPSCGAENEVGRTLCVNCGLPLTNEHDISYYLPSVNKENTQQRANNNQVSVFSKFAGYTIFIVAIIAGIVLGKKLCGYYEFNIGIATGIWFGGFLAGMLFIGIGEIISLLQDLVDK